MTVYVIDLTIIEIIMHRSKGELKKNVDGKRRKEGAVKKNVVENLRERKRKKKTENEGWILITGTH